jgi:uncharacterized protein (TIGR02118 family)
MIKVTVLYPNTAGATFDIAYYRDRHIPLVQKKCGAACKRVAIDKGLGGATPGAPPPYIAIGHLYFDSLESLQGSFGVHLAEFVADIPNFTNMQPSVQISEVIA